MENKMKNLLPLLLVFAGDVFSRQLSPVAHYRRCLEKITGSYVLPTNPYFASKVALINNPNNNYGSDDACIDAVNDIFQYDYKDTVLTQNGYNAIVNKKNEAGVMRVIASHDDHIGNVLTPLERLRMYAITNMHDHHTTRFRNRNILHFEERNMTTLDYYDMTAPAGYFTDALFRDWDFKEIFSRPNSIKLIRENHGYFLDYRPFGGRYRIGGNEGNVEQLLPGQVWNKPANYNPAPNELYWADVGMMLGTKDQTPKELATLDTTNVIRHHLSNDRTDLENAKDTLFRGYSNGIQGSIEYIVKNVNYQDDRKSGETEATMSDGGRRDHRMLVASIFEDFFCRELPVLRADDYKDPFFKDNVTHNGSPSGPKIQFLNPNAEQAFRMQSGCVWCHATMDTLVGLYRHISYQRPQEVYHRSNRSPQHNIHKIEVNQHLIYPDSVTYNYKNHLRSGWLLYRQNDGSMYRKFLNNPNELGIEMGNLDDVYKCALKKYYKFFTRIDVPIFDMGEGLYQLDAETAGHNSFLDSLVPQFKSNQSIKGMIIAILTSPQFKQSDYSIPN